MHIFSLFLYFYHHNQIPPSFLYLFTYLSIYLIFYLFNEYVYVLCMHQVDEDAHEGQKGLGCPWN